MLPTTDNDRARIVSFDQIVNRHGNNAMSHGPVRLCEKR